MADGDIIERLVTQFDADVVKLTDKINGVNKTVHSNIDSWEKRFGQVDFGKALNTSAFRSIDSALASATSKVGALGSGLSALGPLGAAAAVAILAVAAALDQAKKAMDFAGAVQGAAASIGVGVEQLQKFDFVATASDIPIQTMRQGLEGLNAAMGKVQGNLARSQNGVQAKAFKILDITQADLRTYNNAADLLPVIADRIRQLKTAAQQAAVAKALGLADLLPLLKQGGDAIRALQQKAVDLGAVMDKEMITRLADANREFKEMSQVIDVQLKEAFADLAPEIIGIVKLLAAGARALNDFASGWAKIEDRSTSALRDRLAAIQRERAGELGQYGTGLGAPGGTSRNRAMRTLGARSAVFDPNSDPQAAEQAAIEQELARRDALSKLDDKPTGKLGPLPPTTHDKKGDAAAIAKEVQDKLEEAAKGLNDALAALTSDVWARAEFEKKAIGDQDAKEQLDLKALAAKVEADKSLSAAKKRQLLADIAIAQMAEDQLAAAKDQKVDDDTLAKYEADALALKQAINGQMSQEAQIRAGLTHSLTERAQILSSNLLANQQMEREQLNYDNAQRLRGLTPGTDPYDAMVGANQQRTTSLLSLQGAQRDQLARSNQNPLGQYIDQMQSDTDPTKVISDTEVAALKGFNTDLVQAATNAKNLRQEMGDTLRSIGQQLLSLGIEKYLTLPLAQMLNLIPGQSASSPSGGGMGIVAALSKVLPEIPGFALGTPSAPGGLSIIGEDGPELMDVPAGARITPNSSLRGVSVSPGMGASISMPYFDLRGAVTTDDLLQQMNQISASQARTQAAHYSMASAQGMRSVIPAEMARRSTLALH